MLYSSNFTGNFNGQSPMSDAFSTDGNSLMGGISTDTAIPEVSIEQQGTALQTAACVSEVNLPTGNPLLDSALNLARRGFSVVPLKPRTKKPALQDCYNRATADLEKLRVLWEREPGLNIGIVPTSGGLCAIDVDVPLGIESLAALEAFLGKLPSPTVTVLTPNGGKHLFFRCGKSFPSHNGIASGIDIRSAAGHCVVPPSLLLEGDYEFEPGHSFDDLEPAELPDSWVRFFALPRRCVRAYY